MEIRPGKFLKRFSLNQPLITSQPLIIRSLLTFPGAICFNVFKEMRRSPTRPLDGGAGHFPSPQRGTAFQTSPVSTDQYKTNRLIAIEGVIVLVLFCNFFL